MPRFVVLRHQPPRASARQLHWDLMLESGEVLRTWALAGEPLVGADTASRVIDAELLPDHRLAYLDYEGPLSGERGSVSRWDRGTFEILAETEHDLQLALRGTRLNGIARLHRPGRDPQRWRITFSAGSSEAAP